jgi:hypothetical protein
MRLRRSLVLPADLNDPTAQTRGWSRLAADLERLRVVKDAGSVASRVRVVRDSRHVDLF